MTENHVFDENLLQFATENSETLGSEAFGCDEYLQFALDHSEIING